MGRLCLKISRSFIVFSNLVMGVFAIRILRSLPVIPLMTSSVPTEGVHIEKSCGKKKVSFLSNLYSFYTLVELVSCFFFFVCLFLFCFVLFCFFFFTLLS